MKRTFETLSFLHAACLPVDRAGWDYTYGNNYFLHESLPAVGRFQGRQV